MNLTFSFQSTTTKETVPAPTVSVPTILVQNVPLQPVVFYANQVHVSVPTMDHNVVQVIPQKEEFTV